MALVKAETEIRRACKNAWLLQKTKTALNEEIRAIIAKALRSVRLKELAPVAAYSLWQFYHRQWREYLRLQAAKGMLWLYLLCLKDNGAENAKKPYSKKNAIKALRSLGVSVGGGNDPIINGVPMKMYAKQYFRDYVKPTFDRLIADEPRDPGDVSGRNTLRNRAEMEVRYKGHLDQINGMRSSGVKLVIASTHSDCSDRCRPWQGRVYSLDGSSGTTDDGRSYVPLETATDVYYTTKAGVTYKNGLLGFNCRHYLTPYKSGLRFPQWGNKTEDRQYDITKKQRYMERSVRKYKYRAEMYKGQDADAYKEARRKIVLWEKKYADFCKNNHRAIERTRTTIL